MNNPVVPYFKVRKIWHIDLQKLQSEGITTLLLDVDNTVVPWHSNEVPAKAAVWLQQAKSMGFMCYLLSNNVATRVQPLAQKLGIEAVANACKPLRRGIRVLQKQHNVDISRSVLIGDQIFTDILAGNVWGAKTVLVDPLYVKEGKMTWFARTLEKIVMKRFIQYGEDER